MFSVAVVPHNLTTLTFWKQVEQLHQMQKIVVPVICLSRLPFLIYSKQSNLSLLWAKTISSDPVFVTFTTSVVQQKPRNRTTFGWSIVFNRLVTSLRNLSSLTVWIFTCIRLMATAVPFLRTPCSFHFSWSACQPCARPSQYRHKKSTGT